VNYAISLIQLSVNSVKILCFNYPVSRSHDLF